MIEAHGKKFIVLTGKDGALILDAASVVAVESGVTMTSVFVAFNATATVGAATAAITGTLDGVLQFQQRNRQDLNWNDFTSLVKTMDAAAGSAYFENIDFSGKDANVSLTINNLTGGVITIIAILKNK